MADARAADTPDGAPQGDLSALEQRLERLEAENAALKRANESLTGRVTELESRLGAGSGRREATAAPSSEPPAVQAAPPTPKAAEARYEKFKVSGLVFGDAYAVADNHDPSLDGRTGFWIRRGYLTLDSRFADEWSARLRLEVNSPGDFTTDAKLEPFVKDAYLAWKRDGHELYAGLSPSPTFEFIESFWGQRPLEKTPLDLYRFGGSRDMGIAYKGSTPSGRVFYHAMFGNGAGDGSETNDGKKVMASIGVRPMDALVLQVYADHDDRPGATDRTTWQAFAGWTGERSRYGLQYAAQQRAVNGAPDEDIAVASAFGTWRVTDAGTLVARYDRSFDGYSDADRIPYVHIVPLTPFDLAILAWQHEFHPHVQLIPNLEYVHYRGTEGSGLGDDLYGRLTLHFEF